MSYLIIDEYVGDVFGGITSKRFMWFGFDYIFDEDLNPYFVEFNDVPGISGGVHDDGELFRDILDTVKRVHSKKKLTDHDFAAIKKRNHWELLGRSDE